jgi:hypothetical protein
VSIAFGPQLCGTFEEAIRREWLLADGLGGYAMGTVSGLRTRRYHGLLLMDSMIGLVAVEPMLVIGDKQVRLATDEWRGGTVDPAGHELLASFDLTDGVPAGAGRSARSCSSGSSRWRTASTSSASCTDCSPPTGRFASS